MLQNFFQKVRYFDPLDCYRGEVLQKATQTKEVYHMDEDVFRGKLKQYKDTVYLSLIHI